jgi:general stress protein YciG
MLKKLAKSGMFGLAGLAATNPDITNKIARKGGFGVLGMALAKKKKKKAAEAEEAPVGMRGRPMVEDIMMAEEAPAMKKGGKVSAAQAVHKHERAKHKGQPLTKMAKGGSTASKRADGCATKGKTKGRFV